MAEIGYRSDSCYGEGVSNIVDVIDFEFNELNNTDIPIYLREHSDFDDAEELLYGCGADAFVERLNELTGKTLTRCRWLCKSKCDVIAAGYAEDESEISAYKTSDVILSDLGIDGVLYAYTEEEWNNSFI